MASIRDVAKKANVAACTVSRVLNGSASVAEETRQRIEQAMKELNYIPNELARGMFKQRAGIVAMLVPSIRHPFFSSLADQIEKELYQQGYKMMLCSTGDDIAREREYMKTFRSNIVDGVIMGVSNLKDEEYEAFQKPLVMLDHKVNEEIPVVVSDHRTGGILAAQKFLEGGCRNIIHICGLDAPEVLSFQSHRALEEILSARGVQVKAVEIKWSNFDFDGYLELAKMILEKNPEIDGIMAADLPAVAFLKAARQIGRKVPETLCVVAYDGTYVVDTNLLDITTIVQPVKEIANRSIGVLVDLLEGRPAKPAMNMLEVSLREGNTTKSRIPS
ncbi:LacI family DNA-binding transcriptional regulator [Anaerotalea alkaliphila]|uniref:LacI family DNA-binding transcriptional regulator n=1 Tax=Anaerotalea alkaliphila TaxID=2662126 RepID=A0A7X5HTP7_9FIRM|nr:LacI family DNA-binding transcriptional regulator [Anaerotalea alkaliphila]NDL66471.1 LacI family DNA-binding transcriptional regulator [Anaerotalea alkaliphila]